MTTLLTLLLLGTASAQDGSCSTAAATAAYKKGFVAQQASDTDGAILAYQTCLELDPKCISCTYEIGWSWWTRSDWDQTIATWERTLELDPEHRAAKTWLPQAQDNKAGTAKPLGTTGLRVKMNIESRPADAPIKLKLIARFQNYRPSTTAPDNHDTDVQSPKSARFLADGSKVYINSLEGKRTIVYNPQTLNKERVIHHLFDADDKGLFSGETTVYGYPYYRHGEGGDDNLFGGKPVESNLSHNDKYLWVPYYRRDFDIGARSPSAVAIIDTATDTIVRVMPTGPIPKYIAISPDNKWAAVSHWGDNTAALIDISSPDPMVWKYNTERLVVEKILDQSKLGGDRDSSCGFCLRGTVFTPDSKTLLIARMGSGGGLAAFDVVSGKYYGSLLGMKETPRHLVIDHGYLYFSSNRSGYVSRMKLDKVMEHFAAAKGERLDVSGFEEVYVGGGARTIELSPDGRWIFAAVNGRAEVVVVDSTTMTVATRIRADSYTVGLAVSPDGKQVWTTSQGKRSKGGNSVCVFSVEVAE